MKIYKKNRNGTEKTETIIDRQRILKKKRQKEEREGEREGKEKK